jgi:hypothetical protein
MFTNHSANRGKICAGHSTNHGISNKPSDGINPIFPTVVAPGGPGDRPTDGKARNKGSSPATGPKQWTTRIGLGRDEGTIILIPLTGRFIKHALLSDTTFIKTGLQLLTPGMGGRFLKLRTLSQHLTLTIIGQTYYRAYPTLP